MSKVLPVRYRPISGESFKGYMLRLTYLNGYESLSSLHRIMGHSIRPNYNGNIHSILEALAKVIMLDSGTLSAFFNFENEIAVDSERAIIDIRAQAPRVCPECMKEESAILYENWQYAHMTHCKKHGVDLVTKCPSCNSPLAWNSALFEGCDCGFTWSSFNALPSERPRYLQATDQLIGHEEIVFLKMLYQAFIYVLRPLDTTFDIYRTMSYSIDNLSQKFDSAYRLLRDESFQDLWIEKRNDFFREQLSPSSCLAEHIDMLHPKIDNLHDMDWLPEPNISASLLSHESCDAVPHQRQKYLHNISDAHFQLKLQDVSRVLGLSPTTVVYLTDKKVIKTINAHKSITHLLFDIRDINEFTCSITEGISTISRPDSEQKLSLESIYDKIPLFDIDDKFDLGIPIEVIIKSDIPRYIESNTPLRITNLLFDRELLLEKLEIAFIDSISKEYSKVKIGNICGLNEAQYFAFREELGKNVTLREGQHRYISHQVLRAFFENHILINRWCMIRDLDLDEVIADLNESKISFAHPTLLKHGIFIIPKPLSHLL